MPRELATAPESLFWYWINERHNIYLRRAAGQPKPWTHDPILRNYKFTNAFRQLDRGTVWLTENFLEPHRYPKHAPFCLALDDAPGIDKDDCDCGARTELNGLLVGNIAWYRMFNWWGTGEYLGWRHSWSPESIKLALTERLEQGRQVFTNAHIIWSEEGRPKIDAVVDYATAVWEKRLEIVKVARVTRSLQLTFDNLTLFRGIGGFIAYEIVTDLRHTGVLSDAHDIMTWANMGPGAKRGLQRLGLPCKNQREGNASMQLLLARSKLATALDSEIPPLEMRDIEHSLCEFDKYCRVKFGEGEPRMKFNGAA